MNPTLEPGLDAGKHRQLKLSTTLYSSAVFESAAIVAFHKVQAVECSVWWMKPLSCLKHEKLTIHQGADPPCTAGFGVSPGFLQTYWFRSAKEGCSTVHPTPIPYPHFHRPHTAVSFLWLHQINNISFVYESAFELYWRDSGSLNHLVTLGWLEGQLESSVGPSLLCQGLLWRLPVNSVRDVAGNSDSWSLLWPVES